MSHYKHIYKAVDNVIRHLKQAQQCCDKAMHLDKEACGNWKRQLKAAEKQVSQCYKTISSKHNKPNLSKQSSTHDFRKPYKKTTLAEKLHSVLEQDAQEHLYEEHHDKEYYQAKLNNNEPLGMDGLMDYIFND